MSAVVGSAARLVALLAAGIAVCGCLASGAHRPSAPAPVAIAEATHEYPSPEPPRQSAGGGSPSAAEAVTSFAARYINWTAQTLSADLRALAADSVGQARSAMQLAAAQTAGDYELQRGGIANSGTVEGVAPLRGQRDRYVVVTRELTTASATTAYQGLAPAWHISIATVVEEGAGRWVVSAWQPES